MKNILLFTFLSLFIGSVQAQVEITIEPSPSFVTVSLDDSSENPYDLKAHATITNTAANARTYTWTRELISKPDEWGTAVCDVNTCYAPHVGSQEFTLEAGQSAILDVHAYPGGSPGATSGALVGTATVNVVVAEVGNAENTLTGEYELVLQETTSALTVLQVKNLQLFPNPASNLFQVRGAEGLQTVTIYNLLGMEMQSYNYEAGRKIDISNYSKGLYLVALIDDQNQLVKTLKLQKY